MKAIQMLLKDIKNWEYDKSMKKFITVLLVFIFITSCCSLSVLAAEPQDILLSRTVETLDSGDFIIIELYENAMQPRTGKSGHKTATYRNSSGLAIWSVTVNGTFSYTYGVSSTATGASAVVEIFNSNASFVDKNAYTSGNTATATGTVTYNSVTTTRSVSISCDIYGNLY